METSTASAVRASATDAVRAQLGELLGPRAQEVELGGAYSTLKGSSPDGSREFSFRCWLHPSGYRSGVSASARVNLSSGRIKVSKIRFRDSLNLAIEPNRLASMLAEAASHF